MSTDSMPLNRNQWVSLVCMVKASIPDDRLKMRVFNGSLISFKAFEYNATIEFYWSPLLVESNSDDPIIHRVEYQIIRADRIEKHANAWRDADIIIFKSYVWWRKHKPGMRMKVMYGSFEEGDARLEEVGMVDGFRRIIAYMYIPGLATGVPRVQMTYSLRSKLRFR
ncbi:protein trichome birefringence-like 34 [Setaria italica]|uniref:protein trichome birefringence-like 34 n=1 Tax=Setaria italica TaxID=4555 RepID=UPI000350F5FC|nr:protein trichome birefringence-like 34 [Setaria italica]XP_022683979.1 protein trichome birefringence-like 34 [Setaria italica]